MNIPDIEKIIKALDCCMSPGIPACTECPYEDDCNHEGFCDIAMYQVLILLRHQEKEIKQLNRKLKR